ncbi:MAG: chromate transporter [Erysipelotrichaceae bacterium]
MKPLVTLYATFAKIGMFTFGGGYAMLPLLEREIVDKHNWTTKEELLDIFAIGQLTPGIISVNTATFIGYKQKGVLGALFATLGLITPSIVVILMLATVLERFATASLMQRAFAGIQVGVVVILTQSVYSLVKNNLKKPFHYTLFGIVLIALSVFMFSPVWVMVIVVLWASVDYVWGTRR